MEREIKLDGGEIMILKTLGLSGTPMSGRSVIERMEEMATAEFIDSLAGLISLGYVLSSKVNLRKIEDVEHASLRVNPSYSRDLKDAINPQRKRQEEARAKRDRRPRR
jgi:hypothetical protein